MFKIKDGRRVPAHTISSACEPTIQIRLKCIRYYNRQGNKKNLQNTVKRKFNTVQERKNLRIADLQYSAVAPPFFTLTTSVTA